MRQGVELTSAQLERLSTGAVVAEEELVGDRLQYTLLSGTGPQTGWVSLRLKDGKDLLVRVPSMSATGAGAGAPCLPPSPVSCSVAAPPVAPGSRLLPLLPLRMASPVEGRRLRVLAVHGAPANSKVIKFQTGALRSLLGKEVDWIFPDAPTPWAPLAGSTYPNEQERSDFEIRLAQGKPFVQWYRTDVHGANGDDDTWAGVAECSEFLHDCLTREAPIDVVASFSQGSSMVSCLIEQLRKKQLEPPWRLNVFFCGGNIDDAAYQFAEPCLVPTIYISGGASDPFDGFIGTKVANMYPNNLQLRHTDGHDFPKTSPNDLYATIVAEIRRQCGLTAAAAAVSQAVRPSRQNPPIAAPRHRAGDDDDEEFPAGMWTVDYIGNARGPCQSCRRCEYYTWNPNRLRPDQGDDGGTTITEWFLNDYTALSCHGCGCMFSDHKSLGPVNKPAGFYPGLSEEDANALLGAQPS